MAEVVLEKITKIYPGGVKAVDAIDLSVKDGEFIVLVGPSGCGKTTSLRMVAGLEDITGGTIRIGDRVVNQVAPKDRDIAMVFQNYALYPHMTVYKNMAFGLMLRRKQRAWDNPVSMIFAPTKYRSAREERRQIERRVRETAAMLGIENLLDRRPKALSGGQRQRVAVGRAIVREPKAFLFDEPLSNLDAKLRVEMRAELKRLHRRLGTTTLYVTHDQEEAMTLGDRIVVMKDGTVQQCATPLEVYEQPTNRFVAGFVGTPPMNFLAAKIVADGRGTMCEAGGARLLVDAQHQRRLAGVAGQSVVLGLRPELLSLSNGTGSDGPTLTASVEVFEPLGDRMDVHASLADGTRLVCRMDADSRVREGDKIALHVAMERAHYFATDPSGRNLNRPD